MSNFSKKEALLFAFNTLKNHFLRIFGFIFLTNLILFSLQVIIEKTTTPLLFQIINALIIWIVGVIVSMGFIRFCLAYTDGREGNFSDIYTSYPLFWKYLGVSILYGLIVSGGFLLLIIPGFIWAYKFYFSHYLVVDKGLNPVSALRESSRITKGNKWNLLILSLILSGILLAVMVPFIAVMIVAYYSTTNLLVGLNIPIIIVGILYMLAIITINAFSALAYAYAYRRLLSTSVPLSNSSLNNEFPINQPEGLLKP